MLWTPKITYNIRANSSYQEKMRGQRGRLPVQPLGYVMSTKVIFRRVEVFVLAEVCLPRRPHAGQPRSDVWKKSKDFISLPRAPPFSLFTKNLRARQDCMRTSRKTDFRSSKNNFRGHDISWPTPWASLSVPSFSLVHIQSSFCSTRELNEGNRTKHLWK